MTGTDWPRIDRGRTALSLAVLAAVVVSLFAACISNRVTVDASDADALMQAATVHVSLASVSATEAASGTASGTSADARPPAPGGPIDPALESALRARAEQTLRTKGYAIGSAAESDLILELAPRHESVSRRTWSSDPDANGARIVQRLEAVLVLRALRASEYSELWRGEARARLPESALVIGTSAEAVWSRVLDEALERVPDRDVQAHR